MDSATIWLLWGPSQELLSRGPGWWGSNTQEQAVVALVLDSKSADQGPNSVSTANYPRDLRQI